MPERGYQENFYALYDDFQNNDARLSKARKAVHMLQAYGGRPLDQLECLDVGCSSGVITSYAAPYFKSMVGLDYDVIGLGMVTEAQKKEALFLRGDAMTLPFEDQSFDAVICAQVYEHVPNDLRLFAEIERVLRPGGLMFFSGPNRAFPVEPHYYLPFLHWLPENLSDKYLQILGKGNHFYERSRTLGNLRKVFKNFEIYDVTFPVLRQYASENPRLAGKVYGLMSKTPRPLWPILLFIVPNFNWVLRKVETQEKQNVYQVIA